MNVTAVQVLVHIGASARCSTPAAMIPLHAPASIADYLSARQPAPGTVRHNLYMCACMQPSGPLGPGVRACKHHCTGIMSMAICTPSPACATSPDQLKPDMSWLCCATQFSQQGRVVLLISHVPAHGFAHTSQHHQSSSVTGLPVRMHCI